MNVRFSSTVALSVLALAAGRGAEGGEPGEQEQTGEVSLSIGEAPADASCLVVSF